MDWFKKSRSLQEKAKQLRLVQVNYSFNSYKTEATGISRTDSLTLADGSIPMLPVSIDASSDKMSPKMLFVTIVSNCKSLKHFSKIFQANP